MSGPVAIRLDDDVQATLEAAAHARGIALSSYLGELAIMEAHRVRRARIREQSKLAGAVVAGSAEAAPFYDDWGSPSAQLDRA